MSTLRMFRGCPAILLFLTVIACAQGSEVLRWRPEPGGRLPAVRVRVELFKGNDLGIEGPGLGVYWPFGAIVDLFAGQDPTLRTRFRDEFKGYLEQPVLHPAHPDPGTPDFDLYTYRAPYEYDQPRFLAWLKENRGMDDFFEPAARRLNDYKGSLIDPLVPSVAGADIAITKAAMGYLAEARGDAIVLSGDNRYNPTRWLAPVNETHHHEQASLAAVLHAADGGWDATADVLAAYLGGNRARKLLLDYDVEIKVEDHREAMGEKTVWDFYGGVPLSEVFGVTGRVHWNSDHYTQPGVSSQGQTLHPVLCKTIPLWLKHRFIAPDIQIGLCVNWRSREGVYRLSEFMFASKNQQPANYFPPEPGADGFIQTADETLNPVIVDGGNSGKAAWTRVPFSLLQDERFLSKEPGLAPVVLEGGEYDEIPDGSFVKRYRGVVDLTRYYATARARGFFPGQKGFWVNKWVGFESDDPDTRDPGERHGVEWLGVIFENHGPFAVTVTIRGLDARIVEG